MAKSSALSRILDSSSCDIPDVSDANNAMDEDASSLNTAAPGMCVECEDQPQAVRCPSCCDDVYCEVCFWSQHRKGSRAKHEPVLLRPDVVIGPQVLPTSSMALSNGFNDDSNTNGGNEASKSMANEDSEMDVDVGVDVVEVSEIHSEGFFAERARYIPLRLTHDERKLLRLVVAAVDVSEYTDNVDILSNKSKSKRIHTQVHDMCAILSALVVANDYSAGQRLLVDRSFKDNEEFFRNVCEVGRRYKISNPSKLRSGYGKLIYMLMDTASPHIQQLLEFDCIRPIRTVHTFLDERNCLSLLDEELINVATMEILPVKGLSRYHLQRQIKQKERAIEELAHKYARNASIETTVDEIRQCIYSIGDNHAFLTADRLPLDKLIGWLTTMFKPDAIESGFSLAISHGRNGARLTHSHSRQYAYVFQTLTLWREILNDFYKLWYLAEQDLMDSGNPYGLRNTGQGLNRVQNAPRVGGAMRNILHKVQSKVPNWVGSSVIHLGDHNVPNALMFIDKYTQISRIAGTVVTALDMVEKISSEDLGIFNYITNEFGSVEGCQKTILCSLFSSGFDGSGAQNFMDAGSCIDGRLTSLWEWANSIHKKEFYYALLLSGFDGFDGEF